VTGQPKGSDGGGFGRNDWLGLAVFGAAAVSAAVWLMVLGRGLTFFYDEWDFIQAAATTGYWHNLLKPHNGHPSMVPFSVYEALLHTVGLRQYWPYQLVLVLLDIGCGLLLFVLLRRKVHPVVAGAAAAVLMLLGSAWQDLLWPFQIGFLGSVAAGLGALVLLDADSKQSDLGACACLVVGVGCSGVALPFLAGIGVELLWRRRSWWRLWVPAFPLALFVAWYATIGKSSTTSVSPGTMLHSMASATTNTVGSLAGRGNLVGAVLSCILAGLFVVALVRSPGRAARLAMAVTGLAAFWVLTLLARGVSQTSQSRYLYPASVFVLLAVGELPSLISRAVPPRRAPSWPRWTRVVTIGLTVAVVGYAGLAIWWNSSTMTDERNGLAGVASQVRTELAAVDFGGAALPANFQPDSQLMPQVTVGPYLKAKAAFGSPADSSQEITTAGQQTRAAIDMLLLRGRPLGVVPADAHPQTDAAGCRSVPVTFGRAVPAFTLPPHGVVVTAPNSAALAVRARSLSLAFPAQPLSVIPAGSTRIIDWSFHRSAVRWVLALTPVPSPAPIGTTVTVCPLAGRIQRASADTLRS
jgi:hypothetical protein